MRLNRTANTAQIVLFAILFLFFLQALTDFVQSIYAFALLVTGFTVQVASFVLLFSPLALLLFRHPPSRAWIMGIACVAMLGRLLEPMLNPTGRLLASGVSVGAFLLLFPSMLSVTLRSRRPGPNGNLTESAPASLPEALWGWRPASGLLIAVLLSILLRTAGLGLDVSEYGIYQFIAWVLAVLAGRLVWDWELRGSTRRESTNAAPAGGQPNAREASGRPAGRSHAERREQSLRALSEEPRRADGRGEKHEGAAERPAATGRVLGLCIGLAAVILIVYFGLGSPAVISRWTGYPYTGVITALVAALGIFGLLFSSERVIPFPSRGAILAWNALFVLMLVFAILPHQVAFPAGPEGYPLDEPAAAPAAIIPLLLMLVLSPVIFVDLMMYLRQLSVEGPSLRQLGLGFALLGLFLLVMVFLHVFTTTYDYAAPVGPLLRDRFWLVYLIAGLALALPMLQVRRWVAEGAPAVAAHPLTVLIVGLLAIFSVGAAAITSRAPEVTGDTSGRLRVMTYNIQQGFNSAGAADLPGQLGAIKRVGPDVLGLQESDTARIANGNADAVRYFANKLGMYSYYGPTTTTGTFGIALLSKYPIESPRTFFLYSTGEQTAAIQAQITAHGRTYNVFVTHLGNDGPMVQLQNLLARVDGLPNVILMGDFNFDPSTPQYALATKTLRDAWLLRWPEGHMIYKPGSPGRIDLILVSPGMEVTAADYVADPASDHPYLYVAIKP